MNIPVSEKIFRWLCISSVAINLCSILLSFFRLSLADTSLHKLMEYDAVGYMFPLATIWPVFMFSTLTTTIPLFFIYKRNFLAFKIFSLGVSVSILMTIFSGVRVTLPIENLLGTLIYFSWGGIFVVALLNNTSVENRAH
jgi:hypothetical protein